MKQYGDILKRVLRDGKRKQPVRKENGKYVEVKDGLNIMCPNVHFSHDMKDGFPLLTTKKVAWKAVRVELEGFIKGITSKKWYQDRGCKIWNEWANPEVVNRIIKEQWSPPWEHDGSIESSNALDKDYKEFKNSVQLQEDDLGPIYGFQWRRFNQAYDENCSGWVGDELANDADQLKYIVDTLKENPNDRRMVCCAWNPLQRPKMALPPCHWGWNVTVCGDELNLFWVQRSCDLMLGVPFNIASYALLLSLLCKVSGLKPGNLSAMFVDCHIYVQYIEDAVEQAKREPKELPTVNVLGDDFDLFNWTYKDVELLNYNPHPAIKFGGVVV